MRLFVRIGLVAACLVAGQSAAFAQVALSGVVSDNSGAVLPGVTVEAASPVLIEKVRSVTTDGSGQYRIVDLRPGTYSLTFSLQGFNNVKRDNIVLAGTQIITIPVEMRVGALGVARQRPAVVVAALGKALIRGCGVELCEFRLEMLLLRSSAGEFLENTHRVGQAGENLRGEDGLGP